MQERLMNEAMMRNKSLSIADQSMGSSYVPANSGPQLNPPTISSFTRYAAIDDDIIIQGTEFDNLVSVKIGEIEITVVANTSTLIQATISLSVISGDVIVYTTGGSASSSGFVLLENRISLHITSTGELIYQNDSIDNVMAHVRSYPISSPLTLQFNSSDTIIPNVVPLVINPANASHLFTIQRRNDLITPSIDGNFSNVSVVTINTSNVVWDGIDVLNGFTSDIDQGGTNIRLSGNQTNVQIKNLKIKRGYVGIRGTTNLSGITIDNVVIEEVSAGCIRLGGGSFSDPDMFEDFDMRTSEEYDMHNVTIENITCLDTLNGGDVPGTTVKFSPLILVKMTENLTIRNIVHTGNGTMTFVETSTNVLLDRIKGIDCNNYAVAVTGSDNVTLTNSVMKAKDLVTGDVTLCYLDTVRNLSLISNSFIGVNQFDSLNTNKLRRVIKVIGNIFKFDYNTPCSLNIAADINGAPYSSSVANDFQEEHDNVFGCNGTYSDLIEVSRVLSGNSLRVRHVNFNGTTILSLAQYQSAYSGYGINTLLKPDNSVSFSTRINPDSSTSYAVYIPDGAPGRNMIATSLSSFDEVDSAGFVRIFPTDAGAYDRDAIDLPS